jgi:homoserine kinase type II
MASQLPVRPPLMPDELARVRAALGAWELGSDARVEPVPGGATNRVYRVESARQLGFLRVYKWPDRAMVEREHALLAHARAAGLPVVALIAARSGSTVVELEGRFAALYEPARGVQVESSELTLSHASAAGGTLGRLHQALAPLPDRGYARWNLSWDGAQWVERLNVVERALLAQGVRDDTDRCVLERLRAQRAWLAHPDCCHSYEPRSAAQVTHGDYQPANLFFEGPVVSAVIDWEQAAWMPRGYEVVRACAFHFRLEPERTRSFLQAYRAVFELDARALEDGARAWGCFSDHHVWPVEETYLNGNPATRRFAHAPFRPFQRAWAELGLGTTG